MASALRTCTIGAALVAAATGALAAAIKMPPGVISVGPATPGAPWEEVSPTVMRQRVVAIKVVSQAEMKFARATCWLYAEYDPAKMDSRREVRDCGPFVASETK